MKQKSLSRTCPEPVVECITQSACWDDCMKRTTAFKGLMQTFMKSSQRKCVSGHRSLFGCATQAQCYLEIRIEGGTKRVDTDRGPQVQYYLEVTLEGGAKLSANKCNITLRLESKEVPKRVDTERRPRRPSPSLRTQLMPAAAGSEFLAPTPTACSRDCSAAQPVPVRRQGMR